MRMFISWSGHRSQNVASVFADWIRQTIQAVEPWFSNEIVKGKRWAPEIAEALRSSPMGLICLTPENLSNPWLLFEAGAISNTKDSLVCTLLVGLKDADVEPPLGQFQATPFEKNEVKKLLITINECVGTHGGKSLPATTLGKVFEANWPSLQKDVSAIASKPSPAGAPKRSVEDLLEEVLHTLRGIDRRTSKAVLDPSGTGSALIPSGAAWELGNLHPLARARLAQSVAQGTETPLPLQVGTAVENDYALPVQQPSPRPKASAAPRSPRKRR